MEFYLAIPGAFLIAIPAVDLFRELFQPSARGFLSVLLSNLIWRVMRTPARRSRKFAALAGPVIMVVTIMAWLFSSIIGWGFLIMSQMQSGKSFIVMHEGQQLVDAIYLSLVTISTLGYGDIVPASDITRIMMPLEALFGLGIAGGTISWLLTVHPVLAHRATLAAKVDNLDRAEQATGVSIELVVDAHTTLIDLAGHVLSVHSDLRQFPVSYYFFASEKRRSLPDQIAKLLDLSIRCEKSPHDVTKLHGAVLGQELDRLLEHINNLFLHDVDADATAYEVIEGWRIDHQQKVR